jgi:hypothetical protein
MSTDEATTTAYPEYVENEYTEQMFVRRDLADTGEEAIAYIVRELGLPEEPGRDAYDRETVREVHMRLHSPADPDAPVEARLEQADWMQVVEPSNDTVAYWQMQP